MLGLFVSVWPALSLLWKSENVFDMMFIWDAGCRNYLPIRYFMIFPDCKTEKSKQII